MMKRLSSTLTPFDIAVVHQFSLASAIPGRWNIDSNDAFQILLEDTYGVGTKVAAFGLAESSWPAAAVGLGAAGSGLAAAGLAPTLVSTIENVAAFAP
jgi:hypothetical protein